MSDTIAKLRELLLTQSKTGRLRGLLDSIYGAASTGAEAYGSANSPMSQEHSGILGGLLMDFSPLGDAKSAYDGVQSARQGDYLGAGLGALGALPMVPNLGGVMKNIDIFNKPRNELTKADLMKVADRLAIHQDVRPGSADRVSSIMENGLNRGMVDSFDPYVSGKGWSWGRGQVNADDVYLFDRSALKYRGKGNPALKEGNIPLAHFTKQELDDILSR